ncbi:MAG: response regulator [Deltaproteobacteria bacterium]|nr:response regulator [Deltaproteobacteria bacterium]
MLIVDDDPWIRRMVGSLLGRRGHEVQEATNGEHALQVAPSFDPHLVITDVMMDSMDGWTLVRSLRSRPQFNLVPVIFLTALNSEDDRILGFRLGADDYLAKPFRFEELDLRVAKVLRNVDRLRGALNADLAAPVQADGPTLTGDLARLGVSTVLTLLEMERKSGILVINHRPTGRVFFRNGRAVSALVETPEGPRDAEAIYAMLTWTSGSFSFNQLDVEMADSIDQSTTHLLMEGARRIDEGGKPPTH